MDGFGCTVDDVGCTVDDLGCTVDDVGCTVDGWSALGVAGDGTKPLA